jgi:hypothetical protein
MGPGSLVVGCRHIAVYEEVAVVLEDSPMGPGKLDVALVGGIGSMLE